MTGPHLTGLIVVIVIGAGALHAVWNAIMKQLGDRSWHSPWQLP